MESNSDDREPQQPPDVPPDELEEALKWLEEMTARQRGPADSADLSPIASIDSPFSGLIETEPGDDLPDWLRETPAADELAQDEPESRLDWLGKMAQRESVEEQTTVHWRHLGEPDEGATLDEAEMPPAESVTQPLMELETDGAPPPDAIPEPFAEPVEEMSPASDVGELAAAEAVEAASEPEPGGMEPEWVAEDAPAEPPVAAPEPLSPVDDLDAAEAAMAWIEELAVSQDAPIEDVPSVADRALASKLMLEAGLTPDIFGLESPATDFSLLEERTPVNPFVEAEDFADTVVLVETLVADQGGEPAFAPDAPVLPVTILPGAAAAGATDEPPLGEEFVPPEVAGLVDETAEPLSFDEAMAFLDDLAVEAAPASEPDTGPLSEPDEMEATAVEALDAGEAPWVAATATAAAVAQAADDDTPWDEGAVTQPLEPVTFVEEPAVEEVYVEEWRQTAPALGEVASEAGEPLPTLIEPDEEPAPFDVAVVAASGEFADPVEDTPMPASEPEPEYLVASNGLEATSALEAALRELDVLALPPGRTLSDVDMTLRRRAGATPRDLPGALDWLESTLEWPAEPIPPAAPAVLAPEPDLDEIELLDRMPDDPDAALAWLERIAGEEEGAGTAAPSLAAEPGAPAEAARAATPAAPAPPAEAWTEEANLLDMPDDPDEVMAWLEGIAQGGTTRPVAAAAATTAVAAAEVEAPPSVEAETPEIALPPVEAAAPVEASAPVEAPAAEPPAPGLRVNLRKRRFVIREGQPAAPEAGDAGWVDRLEPRE